jgi:hypothetical protein
VPAQGSDEARVLPFPRRWAPDEAQRESDGAARTTLRRPARKIHGSALSGESPRGGGEAMANADTASLIARSRAPRNHAKEITTEAHRTLSMSLSLLRARPGATRGRSTPGRVISQAPTLRRSAGGTTRARRPPTQ